MERRKSTLENRISKLERTLSRNRNEGISFEREGCRRGRRSKNEADAAQLREVLADLNDIIMDVQDLSEVPDFEDAAVAEKFLQKAADWLNNLG